MSQIQSTPNIPTITVKLGKISAIMSDGYKFLKVRMLLEGLDEQAKGGDSSAQEILLQVERFYNLCEYANSRPCG